MGDAGASSATTGLAASLLLRLQQQRAGSGPLPVTLGGSRPTPTDAAPAANSGEVHFILRETEKGTTDGVSFGTRFESPKLATAYIASYLQY